MTMGPRNRRQFLQAAAALVAATRTNLWASPASASETKDKIRGLMVDAARVPENLAWYRRVIDFCSDWELNTLQFRLTDEAAKLRLLAATGLAGAVVMTFDRTMLIYKREGSPAEKANY